MDNTAPVLEQAFKMLERGELPEKVSVELLWAGLVPIFKQVQITNGTVKDNTKRISRIEKIGIFLGGALVTALLRAGMGLLFQ